MQGDGIRFRPGIPAGVTVLIVTQACRMQKDLAVVGDLAKALIDSLNPAQPYCLQSLPVLKTGFPV
jgi:hypothetical protein